MLEVSDIVQAAVDQHLRGVGVGYISRRLNNEVTTLCELDMPSAMIGVSSV